MKYLDYHPDWKDVIRPMILKRDNYQCCSCGIRHKSEVYRKSNGSYQVCDDFIKSWAIGQGKKVFVLYLQVAHLDHNKQNNEPVNLRSLCPRCHSTYDKVHKKAARNILFAKDIEQPVKSFKHENALSTKKFLEIKAFIKQETSISFNREQVVSLISIINKS
jgi:5-methylcytosine-specific restriction endonuclease McrA